MDAGDRCSKRFQVRERSGDTETLFLCASAPKFHGWGGLVYPNATQPGDHGGGANSSWDPRWIGAATRHHRTLWRDVVCSVAEYPRVGAAHGAWCGRIQSIAAGDVAWPGIDGRRRLAGRRGVTRINPIAWKPLVQGESTRPGSLRVRIRGDDHRFPGSMFLARLACHADRSSPRVAGLILCNLLIGRWCQIRLAMIDAIGNGRRSFGWRSANAHLDEVNDPITLWRCKRQAVYVADELRDLGVRGIKVLFGRGEVGAATCGFSYALQQLIRSFELHRRLGTVCCRRFLLAARLRILQAAHERNGQEAHVADLEPLNHQRGLIHWRRG